MAHFYGRICGQAGEATRMGSKRSGYTAWAQTHQGRIRVNLYHAEGDDNGPESDHASIVIEGGHSAPNVTAKYLPAFDLTTVPLALSCGDAKVNRIWERIADEFRKLDAEAPKALKRAERREKIELNKRQRELKARWDFMETVPQEIVRAYMAQRSIHEEDYARGLMRRDESFHKDDSGTYFMTVSDWSTDTGLRKLNLTNLANTIPRSQLDPVI